MGYIWDKPIACFPPAPPKKGTQDPNCCGLAAIPISTLWSCHDHLSKILYWFIYIYIQLLLLYLLRLLESAIILQSIFFGSLWDNSLWFFMAQNSVPKTGHQMLEQVDDPQGFSHLSFNVIYRIDMDRHVRGFKQLMVNNSHYFITIMIVVQISCSSRLFLTCGLSIG